jgi:LysM repeat protein
VSRGQTLSDIAKRYRVSVTMIQSANPSLKPHALKVGQRIIIPMSGRVVPGGAWSMPPESRTRYTSRSAPRPTSGRSALDGGSHRVASGETLSEIARRYGVSLAALLDYNDLTTRSVIHAGQIIKIPPR